MTHDDDREQGSRGIPLKNPQDGEYVPDCMEAEATRLMTAAKHGDREAFESLVLALRARAFFVARSLVGSREDAMDLSQEAFLKTFRARSTYRDGEPFLPWFHRILRNTCFTFLRKNGRLRKHSLSGPQGPDESGVWEIADPDAPMPSDPAEREERARIFWDAFRGLSSRDREILALRHFKELAYQQIAEALGIPVGTVMSRLFHARRRLREALAGTLDDFSGECPAAPGEGGAR